MILSKPTAFLKVDILEWAEQDEKYKQMHNIFKIKGENALIGQI